ncbi:MAG: hypothetical protein P4M14_01415, partial [Gammaproteobacteria bacterium]|nr:hypothetical protein [Gammaproteobacteria bacterium]
MITQHRGRFITQVQTLKRLLSFVLSCMVMTVVNANPSFNSVTSGNVVVTQTPTTTQIQQGSNKAILQWNSFNIGAGERTQFIQPNASSVALNRINPNQGAS